MSLVSYRGCEDPDTLAISQVPDGKLSLILYQSEKVSEDVDVTSIQEAFRIAPETLPEVR